MSREGTLFKNTIIITIGKISTQMISFFLLPLYTAILSTEEFGVVDLLNTLVSLMLPIVTFQIEQAVFRHLIDTRENEKQTKKIISTTLLTIVIQCLVYLAIFIIVSGFIENEYKFFLATNVIACIFSSIMLQIARGLGNNKSYAVGSFITAITTIIFNVLFLVVFKLGAYGMLMASFIANIICMVYILLKDKIYKYIEFKGFEKTLLKELWKYSIPLIPNALSWWIFNASDRIIVTAVLGVSANGILAAAHKFPSVYITIYNIFNMSWTESASMYVNDKDSNEFFTKIVNVMLNIFSAICFCIITAMPFVFPIMINSAYQEAYNQIPILMLGSLANVGIGLISVIYIANKNTKDVAKTSVISAIINISINLILIKFIGLYAASVSTFIAYLSMLIYRIIDVKKYVKLIIDKKLVLKIILMSILVSLSYYINDTRINIITFVITIIYAIMANKKNITFVLDNIVRKGSSK